MEYPSKYIERAVGEFAKLPGIGKKTALRLVLHLLNEKPSTAEGFAHAIQELVANVKECPTCHMVSDIEGCTCHPEKKDESILCVVEDLRDVLAIQSTNQYQGLFHVLGGVIAPIDGITPDKLHIDTLIGRVAAPNSAVKEVLLALPSTMEGETTVFYIARKLKEFDVKISTIARGVPIGSELEYADEVTLGRSITERIAYSITR